MRYQTDSRKIKPGQIFVAIKGHTVDGHDYIQDAIKNGATKIIAEHDVDCNIPLEVVSNTEEYLKKALKNEYADEINKLKIIGLTGTNGKTTTAYLTYQLLNLLNEKSAYIGTIGFKAPNDEIETENTTPDTLTIYSLLLHAIEIGCKTVVMEVSSHALSFERIYGLHIDIAAFTNLTEDHLDYHKTMENYLNAKLMILDHLTKEAIIIANSDDKVYEKFKKENHKFLTYGFNGDYKIINFETLPCETNLSFSFNDKTYECTIPLTSKFNVYNYLTMLSIVNQYGISVDDILKETSKLKAPKGRCEAYKINDGTAVVDYAHTPDAVEKVITAYNELKKGKVITIVGCGGDRDPKKRPIMGEIATRLSDYVIFTSDNPRTEDPNKILEDIIAGVKKDNYEIIENRKEAIKHGLDIMKKNDILLILGKGHENYQIIGKEKIHLDDSEEILNYKK